ncbi:hypothetical protein QUA70_12345 [Microcoleus sp. LAD1_D5]|uniref:hypothetical protein n=1 Tax=unclassified Microcoleus TaxID=2642155 RepID=UPI002FD0B870
MFVAPQYFTDLGVVLGYLQMDVAFVGENIRSVRQIKDLNEIEGLIPQSLKPQLLSFNHSCKSLDISPRFLLITPKTESQRVKISYPFRPNSTEWNVFWGEVRSNPQIISVRGIGETLSNSFLKRHLT